MLKPKRSVYRNLEYAFYTAVANNDSAKELMQEDTLRELAVVLTQRVRENASIDWNIKESVKAKLKVIVKRTLRQFGICAGYAVARHGNSAQAGGDDRQ